MQEIREIILKEFTVNLKDLESNLELDAQEIEKLFDLYDKYAFNNAIQDKIDELYNIKGEIINIAFGLTLDQTPSDVTRICGVIFFDYQGVRTYEIQISSWLLSRIISGFPQDRWKKLILLVFEHELLHLMTLLWNYIDLKNLEDVKLGVHGKLFY